jgi:hypothetical protein
MLAMLNASIEKMLIVSVCYAYIPTLYYVAFEKCNFGSRGRYPDGPDAQRSHSVATLPLAEEARLRRYFVVCLDFA